MNPNLQPRGSLSGQPSLMGTTRGVSNAANWGFSVAGSSSQALQPLTRQGPPSTSLVYQSQQSSQSTSGSVVGGNAGGSAREVLDMSEFPALGSTVSSSVTTLTSVNAASLFGNSLKQQKEEFTMEDFPALPGMTSSHATSSATSSTNGNGSAAVASASTPAATGAQQQPLDTPVSNETPRPQNAAQPTDAEKSYATKASINPANAFAPGSAILPPSTTLSEKDNTTPPSQGGNGVRTDHDRFGLMGILSVIQMTDQDLSTLALGSDLTNLGLNLNSIDALYSSFSTPFTESNQSIYIEPEFHLPQCYSVQPPAHAQTKIGTFSDETLFYIFYSMPKDIMQETASQELYNRNWRYHKDLRLWLTKEPGTEPTTKTATFERGNYIFFDPSNWEKVKKEYVLMYDALEERPSAMMGGVGGLGAVGIAGLGLPGFQMGISQQVTQQVPYSTPPATANRLMHQQHQQQQTQRQQQQALLHSQLQHHPGYANHL